MVIRACVSGALGKMGRILQETAANDSGLKVVSGVDANSDFSDKMPVLASGQIEKVLDGVQVLLIFSDNPDTVAEQARTAVRMGVVPVIGTTKLPEECLQELRRLGKEMPVVQAYNFSPGATFFIKRMAGFAKTLSPLAVRILEIHHANKADWPSGTAVNLAASVCAGLGWDLDSAVKKVLLSQDDDAGVPEKGQVLVCSKREGKVVGYHEAVFYLPGETAVFSHNVHDRCTFAHGAWQAAKWALQEGREPGLYSMGDVLGL